MRHWEFLLQKEGDRFWEPLPTGEIEVEEGRYRIVAQCDGAHQNVEIRLTHREMLESESTNCFLKRNRRISSEGLIVLLPYTYLAPGRWELSCASGDLMSELLGEFWKQSLQIEVLPQIEIQIIDLDEPGDGEEYFLDGDGEELGNIYSPPIPLDPEQYLPEELPEQFPGARHFSKAIAQFDSVVIPNHSSPLAEHEILAALTGQHFSIGFPSGDFSESIQPSPGDRQYHSATNLDLPEPKRMTKVLKQSRTQSNPILPPKINRFSPNSQVAKSPQLPKLRKLRDTGVPSSAIGTVGDSNIIKGTFTSVREAFHALQSKPQRSLS